MKLHSDRQTDTHTYIYIYIYIYIEREREDNTLNNLQRLICHKTILDPTKLMKYF